MTESIPARIAFVGSGVMAEVMISGLLTRQVVPPESDVVILAVKPLVLAKVLKQIKGSIRPGHLVLSVIGGARMKRIGEALGHPARALHLLHQGRFSAILTDAIDVAYRRSLELGDLLDGQVRALQREEAGGPEASQGRDE